MFFPNSHSTIPPILEILFAMLAFVYWKSGENPDGVLVRTPKPTFTPRYADTNDPASSGNVVSFTGGHINPAYLGNGFQGRRDLGF
jgi:hypothetical protein